MMVLGSVGSTATRGSSSVFSWFTSEDDWPNPEMSQPANGLLPSAGGPGVPDAWLTAAVTYGPAAAGSAIGTVTNTPAAKTTPRHMRPLMTPPFPRAHPSMRGDD